MLSLNYLYCQYEGINIKDDYLTFGEKIYDYFNKIIIKDILVKKYKIDIIKYYKSPNNLSFNEGINYFKCYKINKIRNDFLIVLNDEKFLESRKYNLRREIKKGIKNLEINNEIQIINNKSEIEINKILKLQSIFVKEKKLKNFEFDRIFFQDRIDSPYYTFSILKYKNEYIFVNINSVYKNFITNHYMVQNNYSKKNYLSKAMYYKFMTKIKKDQRYILGIEKDNNSVDWFKNQFSNHKKQYYVYELYISLFALNLFFAQRINNIFKKILKS